MKTTIITRMLFILILGLFCIQCKNELPRTLLIKNATIIDGTGSSRIIGSVRLEGNKIIEIGDLNALESDSIIDATGLVLSPGFIDTHSHHDWDSLRSKEAAVSQGITTIIVGQDGGSWAPLKTLMDSIVKSPWSVNVGSYSGHNSIRNEVLGEDYKREASQAEIEEMKLLLEADLQNGALGFSTGLEYDPGIYSSTEEVIELAKVASKYNGRYISHMRSEDINLTQSIDEIIEIGAAANIPVQISHFKLARRGLWGKAPEILKKLDSARTEGIAISVDIYPYQYWQSTMTVLFPKRDFENRESAAFALTELTTPEGMIISDFTAKPEYKNLTLAEIAELRKEDPVTTYIALIKLAQETPGESIIAKSMDLEDIKSIMNWSHTNLCSDGSSNGHPRGWGSFPKYLNMETGQSLEAKINKMTLQAATNLNLEKIGAIKEGYYADLVLFDPNSIKDKATFENSALKSEGIRSVMVSGEVVYVNQTPTKVYSGRIVKRTN